MNLKISLALPFVTVTAALLTACSFSTSSESSSDSSKSLFDLTSSPLTSSSESSATAQHQYRKDIADYTNEFATSSTGTMDEFREQLSEIAQRHGVTDWENDLNTYKGIGQGLKKAKLTKPVLSAFIESISDNDPMKKQAIEDGME